MPVRLTYGTSVLRKLTVVDSACAEIAPQNPHVQSELARYKKEFDNMQKDSR